MPAHASLPVSRSRAIACVLLAATLWASSALAPALPGAPATAWLACGRLIAGAAFLALMARGGGASGLLALPPRPLFGAAIGMAAFQWLFFAAAAEGPIGGMTLLSTGVAPFAANLSDIRRRPRRAALLTSLMGIACLLSLRSVPGAMAAAAAIASGVAYSFYARCSAEMTSQSPLFHPSWLAALCLGAGGIALIPAALMFPPPALNAVNAALILGLGIAATALPYALFAAALPRLGAPTALALLMAQPLVAAGLGAALLGQRTTPDLILALATMSVAVAAQHVIPLNGEKQ
jgi:drug/metabolite transporter, DME family